MNILNPTKALAQVAVLAVFFLLGSGFGAYLYYKIFTKPCDPVTQINVDQKNRIKKGSTIQTDLTNIIGSDSCDYNGYIQSLTKSEIRKIRNLK